MRFDARWSGLLLVAVLAPAMAASQFLRHSLGVTGTAIAAEIGFRSAELGILGGAFYLSFAATQIPLGAAIDSFGPRRTLLASIAVAIAGVLLFAVGSSFTVLVAARLVMGVGCASFLMAPMVLYTRWFPPRLFSTLAGITLGLSMGGTLLATAPLALATRSFGWRPAFWFVAVVLAGFAVLVWFIVRDAPPGHAPQRRPAREADGLAGFRANLGGLGKVFARPGLWRILAMMAVATSTFATLLGLWADPYLRDVQGLSADSRGAVLLAMGVAQLAGLFFWGMSERWIGSRKRSVMAAAAATAAILLVLAVAPLPALAVSVLLIVFGFVSGYVPLLLAQGRDLFPDAEVGRGMTVLNTGLMGGVFVMQAISGGVMALWRAEMGGSGLAAPEAAYRSLFALIATAILAALWGYRRHRDKIRGDADWPFAEG